MNSENMILDRIITSIREEDPSPEEVRSAVDRLKRRLGSPPTVGDSQARPTRRSRDHAGPVRWRRPMLRLGIGIVRDR